MSNQVADWGTGSVVAGTGSVVVPVVGNHLLDTGSVDIHVADRVERYQVVVAYRAWHDRKRLVVVGG